MTQNLHIKMGKALFKAAESEKAVDHVATDMEGFLDLMGSKKFRTLMQEIASLPAEAAKKVLQATFHGKINTLSLNLLMILADQRSLKIVGKVAEVFRKHYHEAKDITELVIRTAREFSPQEQLNFIQNVQGKKKHPVSVKFDVDPTLIAGVQIYEKSYLTDYSVKNYLETLQKHLLSTNN